MFLIVLHLEEVNSYLKMSVFNVLFLRRCQHSGANLNGGGGNQMLGSVLCRWDQILIHETPIYIYIFIFTERPIYM